MPNVTDIYLTAGEWYPKGGWASLPAWVNPFSVGVQTWDGRWYIEAYSPAWNAYQAGPPAPSKGSSTTTSAPVGRPEASSASSAPDDMATEYANDPALGVVPVGEVIDASAGAQVWRLPARLVARILPSGPVAPWIASVLDALPWAVWGLLAYVVWKRSKK